MSLIYQDALKYFPKLNIQNYNNILYFSDLLLRWNKKFALLGNTDNLFFYIIEALEFVNFISERNNKVEKIVDLGSGNGLPAIVIAICLDIPIILTEKVFKKICFLKKVVSDLKLKNVTIYHGNIKDLRLDNSNSVFTSKAFASLSLTLDFMEIVSRETIDDYKKGFFLKGKKVFNEIYEAEKKWSFFYKIHDSIVREGQYILEIELNGKKNSNF
jgi:16S rRNA (guanine527-N7)-methyltransferase